MFDILCIIENSLRSLVTFTHSRNSAPAHHVRETIELLQRVTRECASVQMSEETKRN